jgi:ubiquinone/menaquinone biosynthesis C-methylase UbiE
VRSSCAGPYNDAVNLYERYVLPRLMDLAMRNKVVEAERARLIPRATGSVLEIGIGSGLNLPFYSRAVERLYAIDPRREMWALARHRLSRVSFPVDFVEASAERIPMNDRTVDTVVTTWTLCSIPDPRLAVLEIARVLRPGGQILFVEHGRAPDPRVVTWQDRLNPLWKRIAGGCNLNRKIDTLLLEGGFSLAESAPSYVTGLKLMTYLYRGVARPVSGSPALASP